MSRSDQNQLLREASNAAQLAKAISKYLFGESIDPKLINKFTLEKIKSEGDEIISINDEL
ncbi:hypothetical protein ACFL17_08485 [Pseudomonadota bacterium]